MRRGFKTTEFLVTAATLVAVLAGTLVGSLPPKYAAIAAAISSIGYAISRGLSKAGGAEAFPALAEHEETGSP